MELIIKMTNFLLYSPQTGNVLSKSETPLKINSYLLNSFQKHPRPRQVATSAV